MTIEEQLKSEILSKYKSVRAFTVENNIPYTTVDSIFKRGIMTAGIGTTLNIFGALGLDIESIQSGILQHKPVPETKKSPSIEDGDEDMLNLYHRLDHDDRIMIQGEIRGLLLQEKYRKDSGSAVG